MLSINLLPQNIKKELKLKSLSNSINAMIGILSIFLVFCVASLYFALFFLSSYYDDKQDISSSMSKNSESYTKELLAVNANLNFISTAQSNYVSWSDLLYSLGQLVNNDLNFNSLVIDKNAKTLTINGHAKTRDSLLAFKEKIENNKNLSSIAFPLKTLFEKDNIDFNITATINSYEFSKL